MHRRTASNTFPASRLLAVLGVLGALGCGDGTSATSDSGAASDDDGSVIGGCSAGCEAGLRCVDGVCTVVPRLYVSLGETAFTTERPSTHRVQAVAYAPARDAVIDERPVLAESGDCVLRGPGAFLDTHVTACGDWGTVTATGVSPLDHACVADVANVFEESEGLLSPGSRVTVTGTGGAVFPAFSQEVELAPSLTGGALSAVEAGAAIEATWNPAGGSTVYVLLMVLGDGGESTMVQCRTSDSGRVVIDPSISSRFPTPISTWFASIARWDQVHLEPLGAEVVIDVATYADLRLEPAP